jgi:hypothetical protein
MGCGDSRQAVFMVGDRYEKILQRFASKGASEEAASRERRGTSMSYYNRRDIPVTTHRVSYEEMTRIIQRHYDELLLRYAELEIELERTGRKLAEYRAKLDERKQKEQQDTQHESTTG